jgi:hypothetical protein
MKSWYTLPPPLDPVAANRLRALRSRWSIKLRKYWHSKERNRYERVRRVDSSRG